MFKYKQIIIDSSLISFKTEKAYLIKVPNKDRYFWYPKSLIKNIEDTEITLYFKEFFKKELLDLKFKKTGEFEFLDILFLKNSNKEYWWK